MKMDMGNLLRMALGYTCGSLRDPVAKIVAGVIGLSVIGITVIVLRKQKAKQ